jgi:hypothetical protein
MDIETQASLYEEGNFLFISEEHTRKMIRDAYNAMLSVPGGLEEMKKDPGINGYLFSTPSSTRQKIDQSLSRMETGGYHSGSSYAMTMREVQAIARLGWSAYVQMILIEQSQRDQQQKLEQKEVSFFKLPEQQKKSVLEKEDVIKVCAFCLGDNSTENSYVIQSEEKSNSKYREDNYVSCGHVFHQACLEKHIQEYHKKKCPLCAAIIESCYLLDCHTNL